MSRNQRRPIHVCTCPRCLAQPKSAFAEEHRAINRLVATMDEKRRRRFVGFLAQQQGRGGIELLARITGLSHKTIRRGMQENQRPPSGESQRVRCPGGGRKRVEQRHPEIVQALDELLQDVTAGDPMSELKWTHKSTAKLCRALRRRGFAIGRKTVARLLRQRKYSLRTNRKCLAGTQDPDRDRQFRFLVRQRRRYLRRGWPVISVDTKKKEMIGNFKNPGRCWRREARKVLDHDFRRDAVGIAISYGIYDVGRNRGFVVIGTSHETAAFAVAAIRRWWLQVGQKQYPRARRLLIEADGGGANGSRPLAWKVELQKLADALGLILCVSHLPPGASKWNLIEHRMFGLISENWAGEPLASYEVMMGFIRHTKSEMGFRCRAMLDRRVYATKVKISKAEKAALNLKPRRVLPKWNYVIRPHNTSGTKASLKYSNHLA
jgi:Rhodopirellula transposase DDE domain